MTEIQAIGTYRYLLVEYKRQANEPQVQWLLQLGVQKFFVSH